MRFTATYCSADDGTQENASVETYPYSMGKCQDILTTMQLDLKLFLAVVKFLVANPKWREIFVHMTP
ncbi:hypothetical protein Patl1_15977 [Pistacia atlantica]|uniref:Uncharacterized protein n=1 Tax=Pistacia atlantica TaxID=434234 RepID=A0ACC1B685_9ROSI|nr:hypothetical protein Patl1_15977 [Pistacia atlantica]